MLTFIKKIKVNSLIKKSVRLYNEGEFDSTMKIINKALSLSPNCEKALYLKAKVHQISGKLNESLILYDEIINMNPKCVYAWIEKSSCFTVLNKYDEALKALNDGLNFNKNDYNLIRIKIRTFKEFGRYYEGLKYARSIIKNVDKELGIELKGEILLSEDKLREAYNCFHKLSIMNSKNIDGWYGLSSVSYYLKNLDDAIKYMEKCIELDKKNPNFLLIYTSYLIENESYDKALKILNKSLKSYKYFNFYYLRGVCLEFLDNQKEAEKTYKKALKIGAKLIKSYPNERYLTEVIDIIIERLNCPDETKKYFEKYNKLK